MSSVALAKPLNDSSRKTLWDPWKVLNVYPKNSDFSCVGVTRAGFRCRWQFWNGQWALAEADLELMSTMQPSQVSEYLLMRLARHGLCADNHQYQAYDKVKDWSARISGYLKEFNEQLSLTDELGRVKAELGEDKQQTLSPNELASLRGKVAESALTIQVLRESERARRSEMISLNEQVAAFGSTILTLERNQKASLEEIERLTKKCAEESNRASVANELCEQFRHETTGLQTEKDAKAEEVERLKQDVWNLEADLEENQRLQRTKGRETDNLRQQLNVSNALIKELQATKIDTERLHQEIQNINKTMTESNRQVSQLKQDNRRLKIENYFRVFCDHTRLLAKQKSCERTAMENHTLSEHTAGLTRRLEEADMQLAAQDVSTTT